LPSSSSSSMKSMLHSCQRRSSSSLLFWSRVSRQYVTYDFSVHFCFLFLL
jgi:hypothetical protein